MLENYLNETIQILFFAYEYFLIDIILCIYCLYCIKYSQNV